MGRVVLLSALLFLFLSFPASLLSGNDSGEVWMEDYESPMELGVTYVEIEQIGSNGRCRQTGGGEPKWSMQASPGTLMEDAHTTSVAPFEEYHFFGGGSTSIDHTITYCDATGNYPKTACFGFAWQPCGNGTIFPPLPSLLGTILDGEEICLSIPFSGCFIITVGVDGFDTGSWDWMALADYDATGPVNPLGPDTDTFGGSKTTMALYDGTSDVVGEGFSGSRPWCFEVHP